MMEIRSRNMDCLRRENRSDNTLGVSLDMLEEFSVETKVGGHRD